MLNPETVDRIHIDQAVARARHFVRLLNETLDELVEYGIDCVGTSPSGDRYIPNRRRVELVLRFNAAQAEAKADGL